MAARKSIAERFWEKVDRSAGPGACWPWLAYRDKDGYGRFSFRGGMRLAHRVAWELHYGEPPPPELDVLHRCDSPPCSHVERCLFLGTPADNARDRADKGRSSRGGHHWNARLTEGKVLEIRARLAQGDTRTVIAYNFSVSASAVVDIDLRRTWRHV